jgi:hypothetical protein
MTDASEKAQLDAFKNLEAAMSDAMRMASVNNSFVEHLGSEGKEDGFVSLRLLEEQHDNLLFLAFHTMVLVRTLHREYYACFDHG